MLLFCGRRLFPLLFFSSLLLPFADGWMPLRGEEEGFDGFFSKKKTHMQYVHENLAGKLTCGKTTSSFGESRTWSPSFFFAISGDDGWLTRERGEEEKGLEVVG